MQTILLLLLELNYRFDRRDQCRRDDHHPAIVATNKLIDELKNINVNLTVEL